MLLLNPKKYDIKHSDKRFQEIILKTIDFFEKYFERVAGYRIFLAEISAVSQDFVITRWGAGYPVSSFSTAAWCV